MIVTDKTMVVSKAIRAETPGKLLRKWWIKLAVLLILLVFFGNRIGVDMVGLAYEWLIKLHGSFVGRVHRILLFQRCKIVIFKLIILLAWTSDSVGFFLTVHNFTLRSCRATKDLGELVGPLVDQFIYDAYFVGSIGQRGRRFLLALSLLSCTLQLVVVLIRDSA